MAVKKPVYKPYSPPVYQAPRLGGDRSMERPDLGYGAYMPPVPTIGTNTFGEVRPLNNFDGGGSGSTPTVTYGPGEDWVPYNPGIEPPAPVFAGVPNPVRTGGITPLSGSGLSPQIAARLATNEATRRLQLRLLAENTGLDVSYLDQAAKQAKVRQADQYNRQLPTVASSFLSRGLASSGITNTGIARFHQDYRTAVAELDTTYAQNRAKLLKQIADAEAQAAQGSANDSLSAGADNAQWIADTFSRYA